MDNTIDNPPEKNIVKEISAWKEKREAVILAHVYQPGEIQDIADFTGDSLFLSQQAAKTKAKVIVFCGVRFMAETKLFYFQKLKLDALWLIRHQPRK